MQYSSAFKVSGLEAERQSSTSATRLIPHVKVSLVTIGTLLAVPAMASAQQYMTTDSFMSFEGQSSQVVTSQNQVVAAAPQTYQAVPSGNVISGNVIIDKPVKKAKKRKKVVRKKKRKPVRVASAAPVSYTTTTSTSTSSSGLRPGEVVIYDSRWASKKRSSPPTVVNEIVYDSVPTKKKVKNKAVGEVIWDSSWSAARKRQARRKKGIRVASLGSAPVTLKPRPEVSRPRYGRGQIYGRFSSCFPSSLRRILRAAANRFGSIMITSGYRSPSHNRRVGGARNSQHVACRAADIKAPGVNKYTLARFLRRQPGRGSVGTYGCKGHVHVDVGPYRNWHAGCGRRRYARRYR